MAQAGSAKNGWCVLFVKWLFENIVYEYTNTHADLDYDNEHKVCIFLLRYRIEHKFSLDANYMVPA